MTRTRDAHMTLRTHATRTTHTTHTTRKPVEGVRCSLHSPTWREQTTQREHPKSFSSRHACPDEADEQQPFDAIKPTIFPGQPGLSSEAINSRTNQALISERLIPSVRPCFRPSVSAFPLHPSSSWSELAHAFHWFTRFRLLVRKDMRLDLNHYRFRE